MPTSQDRIIEQLKSEIERLTLEIDEIKEELQISEKMLEDVTGELQKNQGD